MMEKAKYIWQAEHIELQIGHYNSFERSYEKIKVSYYNMGDW